jgi:hypothetical protein
MIVFCEFLTLYAILLKRTLQSLLFNSVNESQTYSQSAIVFNKKQQNIYMQSLNIFIC